MRSESIFAGRRVGPKRGSEFWIDSLSVGLSRTCRLSQEDRKTQAPKHSKAHKLTRPLFCFCRSKSNLLRQQVDFVMSGLQINRHECKIFSDKKNFYKKSINFKIIKNEKFICSDLTLEIDSQSEFVCRRKSVFKYSGEAIVNRELRT